MCHGVEYKIVYIPATITDVLYILMLLQVVCYTRKGSPHNVCTLLLVYLILSVCMRLEKPCGCEALGGKCQLDGHRPGTTHPCMAHGILPSVMCMQWHRMILVASRGNELHVWWFRSVVARMVLDILTSDFLYFEHEAAICLDAFLVFLW